MLKITKIIDLTSLLSKSNSNGYWFVIITQRYEGKQFVFRKDHVYFGFLMYNRFRQNKHKFFLAKLNDFQILVEAKNVLILKWHVFFVVVLVIIFRVIIIVQKFYPESLWISKFILLVTRSFFSTLHSLSKPKGIKKTTFSINL